MRLYDSDKEVNPWVTSTVDALTKYDQELQRSVLEILNSDADEFEVDIEIRDEKDLFKTVGFLGAIGAGIQRDGYRDGKLMPTPLDKQQLYIVLKNYLPRITRIDAFKQVSGYENVGYTHIRVASYERGTGNTFTRKDEDWKQFLKELDSEKKS